MCPGHVALAFEASGKLTAVLWWQYRFALLSQSALEAPLQLDLPGGRYGQDCIFIANDWHASMVSVYLAGKYRPHGVYQDARSILAIHNLRHQACPGLMPVQGMACWQQVHTMMSGNGQQTGQHPACSASLCPSADASMPLVLSRLQALDDLPAACQHALPRASRHKHGQQWRLQCMLRRYGRQELDSCKSARP